MYQSTTSKNSSKYILRDDDIIHNSINQFNVEKEQQVTQERISNLSLGNMSSTAKKSSDQPKIFIGSKVTKNNSDPIERGLPLPPNTKRYWGEEKNFDSIYSIYLKKISYTFNDATLRSSAINSPSLDLLHTSGNTEAPDEFQSRGRKNFFSRKNRRRSCSVDKYSVTDTKIPGSSELNLKAKLSHDNHNKSLEHASQRIHNSSMMQQQNDTSAQFLQWETRQIRVLQAATLDHIVKFILLINSTNGTDKKNPKKGSSYCKILDDATNNSLLEEERNNVAHIIHVLFCTYRIYTNPYKLMLKILEHSKSCRPEQFKFVMHYWMDNYPEDFRYPVKSDETQFRASSSGSRSLNSAAFSNSSAGNFRSSERSVVQETFQNHGVPEQCSMTSCDSSATVLSSIESNNTVTSYSQSSGDEGTRLFIRPTQSKNLLRNSSSSSKGNSSLGTTEGDRSLVDELMRHLDDESIHKKAIKISELNNELDFESDDPSSMSVPSTVAKNSSVLDHDSRYVSQQLTAIDLENFLCLRTYSLLKGTKSDRRVQSMIRNFNLLSRHVIITILKSHSPHTVASHWISIAMHLRKMKNFNSLKAIIAGLTNESIYRLKQTVWGRVNRTDMASFKLLSSIVDDVNNQTVLRQTQLIIEGTAKMNMEEDSFGTIPYLGTFLTDLNVIDARYPNFVPSPQTDHSELEDNKDGSEVIKLINIEKCAKQFEILTQVQLLQKNVLASLYSILRKNHFDRHADSSRIQMESNQTQQLILVKPCIPQVSIVFKTWFHDKEVSAITDKQCYEISLNREPNINTK